jgi:propanediol dehydratase small subunit
MRGKALGVDDYPLAERRLDLVRSHGGLGLKDLTMAAVLDGSVGLDDLRITPEALRMQADIARAAGRSTLAENFERAAEMAVMPQAVIMQVYEQLRPGRAGTKEALLETARSLEETYGARRMADFVREAAEVYERRGLFAFRY